MGFVEEKKENDSMNGTNCVHDGGASFEDDLKKVDDKIAMANSFEMDGDEGKHGEHEGLRQQEMPHENSQMAGLTGTSPSRQQQPINTNCNDQTAQQLLTQSSLNPQQHQRYYLFKQLGQPPNTTVSAIPQQTLGYLAQSPTNSTNGHLNLLAAQNTLVQNHQQAVAQAQVSALIGGVIAPNGIQPSNGFVTNPIPSLNGSVVPNVFPLEQQQIQTPQNQMNHQQTVQIAGSSVSSINAGFPPTLPNTVVQLTQPNAMPQSLFATVPFTAPSIFGPTGLSTSLTLSPQQTIPHYIPPTPASWGAPLPTLTVQDRPLVPPIYNGINPNYPKAQMIHSHPPIFCVHEFLTPAECDFLIEAASDAFGPAPVVGKGQGEVSPSRTSSTCYLAREDLPEYLRKVSLLTGKPVEHCELPQVGRYLPSQQYLQHFDAFDLSNEDGRRFAQNGGQRTVTVLTYLNDVAVGGATAFPNLNLQVQPRRGMAIVFFPSSLDGLLDKMALHAAMPAVDIKYVSQVWIRQTNYDGRPSKRLMKPMVAGLQEQREELEKSVHAQLLMGQFGMQQVSASQQQHQQ